MQVRQLARTPCPHTSRPCPPAAPAAPRPAVAAAGPFGPARVGSDGSGSGSSKPDWVRILEDDARVDEEVAELLRGTDGDPDKIRAKMEAKLASPFGSAPPGSSSSGSSSLGGGGPGPAGLPFEARTGSDAPPHITFREVDVFDLWVWLELLVPPGAREQELLQSTVKSWFVVGKLGGFNTQNLQVYYNNSDDNSYLEYDSSEAASSLSSYMHSCSDVEFKGSWARFHVDLGTADELAFDVLINMLVGFSHEVAGISRIQVGGEHERWQVPVTAGTDADDEDGPDADGVFMGGRPPRQHGQAPKVGINPMKLPTGIEEELDMLDEMGLYSQQGQQQQQQQQREWGKGLRPVGAAQRGSFLRQQRHGSAAEGSVPAASTRAGSASSNGSSRSRQGSAQQPQPPPEQVDVPPGMTLYSEEDFRRIFGMDDSEEL